MMIRNFWKAAATALAVAATLTAPARGTPMDRTPLCAAPQLAFRLDDVQDWWLSAAQQSVIQLFSKHRLPLTLGVIGGFIGEDKQLTDIIKSNLDGIELANHGLHAKNDPSGLSILLSQSDTATMREIQEANDKIEKTFGRRPTVFIPHQNRYNVSLLGAIGQLKFSRISSSCLWHVNKTYPCDDPCGYPNAHPCGEPDAYGLLHVPVGAATQWEPEVGKGFADYASVLDQIQMSNKQYGFAVVMLHPQDFVKSDETVDPKAISVLNDLLSGIKEKGPPNTVTLSQVVLVCR